MSWPSVQVHTFDYHPRPAVCIKIRYLPLDSEQENALLEIICNEMLSGFLYNDLGGIIDMQSNTEGITMYTGGRSGGWLYADIHADDVDDMVADCLKQTAMMMLDQTKEHIAHYLDPDSFGWDTMIGDGMDVQFYHNRATLVIDGKPMAGYTYEYMPSDSAKEDRIIRLLLVNALRSAIDLTSQED